jgi:hypothetical protein
VILEDADPLLHKYVLPPEAESVALCPSVIVTLLHALAVGFGLTVTVQLAVSLQLPLATITVYEVVAEGDAVIEEVVAPVFHEYVAPPEALSIAFCPAQIVMLVAVAMGGGATTMVIEVVLVHKLFELLTE